MLTEYQVDKGDDKMQAGKLSPSALQQFIFDHIHQRRPEVVLTAALGEDSAALNLSGDLVVVSTDPITGAGANAGWLAVHVSCNDVASNGADPVAILLTVLLPLGSEPSLVGQIVMDAERAAAEVGAQIVGGHTEVTAAVNQPIISTTVIGRSAPSRLIKSSGIKPGDALIASKYIGLEGTSIIALDYSQLVLPFLGEPLLAEAQALANQISIVPEARIAARMGAHAMHDVTEGGVLGAAYEMAAAANLGFVLRAENLPIHPATAILAQHFDFDPLRLISSGTLLIASDDPQPLVAQLIKAKIPAAVIGEFTASSQKLLLKDGIALPVPPPESDELWRWLAQMEQDT
jgi:hydrogenase expression/formation protein HypE